MHYARDDAKAYARANLTGIWAAALTPFTRDLRLDEDGFRENVRHWIEDLGIAGLFVCGKQGEFFSMSPAERKRTLELAVEAVHPGAQTMMSCSDQNLDVVLDLARHAQEAGADYIVVHAPRLHFATEHDETVYRYYETISKSVNIGIALWSHPDSGYLMSPQLCDRLADLHNVPTTTSPSARARSSCCRPMCATRRSAPRRDRSGWSWNPSARTGRRTVSSGTASSAGRGCTGPR